MMGTDTELKDLLEYTLEELYGIRVWCKVSGIFHIEAGGKRAIVSRREILMAGTGCKKFVALLKSKLSL